MFINIRVEALLWYTGPQEKKIEYLRALSLNDIRILAGLFTYGLKAAAGNKPG